MAEVTIQFFSGLISADPGTLPAGGTFEQRHLGYSLVDDGGLPADAVITDLRAHVCRARHATHGESILDPPNYAIFLIPAGHTIPATNDAHPSASSGWVADWRWESGSQAPLEVVECETKQALYPVQESFSSSQSLINPETGLIYTVADLIAATYGVIFITQNNQPLGLHTFSEAHITEMSLVVTYEPAGPTPPTIPPPDSVPCCGSGPDPTNPDPSSTPSPGNPPIPLQPWTPQCAGGGTVPFAADVTDLESWAL